MSARAIASATVSFGLVSIPIKLYSSGEASSGIHFNMLHRSCGSRLKQQYVCPKDEVVVTKDEIAKGYEFAKGQYVMFTDEELKALQERPTYSLDITEFIPTSKIDPIYFERAYYLGPDKGGDRAYKLLAKALAKSERSALAKYAARGKQYLVLLRPIGDALAMHELRYADEVRPISEVPQGDAEVNAKELKLAMQIVEQGIAEEFRPTAYEDEVRKRILAQIERKVEGREIAIEPQEEPKAQVIDLMAALRSSLSKMGGDRRPAMRAPRVAEAVPRKSTTKKKASSRRQ
jgi:DNA end-binding protein Ku